MITIREDTHQALSGSMSLFVTFNYDKDVINILKSVGTFNYSPKKLEWEVPISSLSYLLDNLTYFDDIDLILYNDSAKYAQLHQVVKHKIPLFPHQEEAVDYGLNEAHKRWMLLDAPGLGKSLSMIALAEELHEQKGIEHCLIICGINSLKANWEKEIKKHSNLDSIIIGKRVNRNGNVVYNSISERVNQLIEPIKEFFVIINIESIREDRVVDAILHSQNKFNMLVLDEAHCCAGTSSHQSKNMLKLEAEYMVAMTGTLITNSPISAYTPLAWIGAENKRGVTKFKQTYCVFDTLTKGRILGYKNMDILQEEIDRCSLRRSKDIIKLPPKNHITEYLEMDDAHRKFYEDVKNGVKEECDKIDLKPNMLLSLVTRLRQATSCPSVLTTKDIPSTKEIRCMELVDELVGRGEKVVIFSNFKEPCYSLYNRLKDYNPLLGTGDLPDDEVSSNVDKFQNDDKYKVFIGTIKKMGTGITLTRASYLIFLDTPWTYALFEQAEDRIHRLGSEKSVFIYNLICENTIDNAVDKIIQRKESIGNYLIDDKVSDESLKVLKDFVLDM